MANKQSHHNQAFPGTDLLVWTCSICLGWIFLSKLNFYGIVLKTSCNILWSFLHHINLPPWAVLETKPACRSNPKPCSCSSGHSIQYYFEHLVWETPTKPFQGQFLTQKLQKMQLQSNTAEEDWTLKTENRMQRRYDGFVSKARK